MKTILLYAFAILAISFPAMADEMKKGSMPPLEDKSAATLAVFYADWCGKCKVLEPKMMEAMAALSEDDKTSLKIVKFDFSDEKTKAESATLAAKNGLTDVFQYYAPKTGFAVLYKDGVDLAKQEKLMADDTAEDLQEKMEVYIHDQTKAKG